MIFRKIIVGLLSLAMIAASGQGLTVNATETPTEQNAAEKPLEEQVIQEDDKPEYYRQAPSLLSEGVMVMDAESGRVLYEKNGFKQYMPASTTKMMTALLAVEHLKLDEQITVGPNPPYAEGASMGFKEGEIVSVNDLLHSLLLHSANDAAEILAEAISGSVEEFAVLMNQKAKELGCLSTNFMNPSGLTDADHKSTPYDLSLIARAAALHPILVEIDHTYSHKLAASSLDPELFRWATNKNALLNKNNELYYEPIIVAKTGWTPDAGFSHTAVAEKDGKRFVVTVMRAANQRNYWEETRTLFEWAFTDLHVTKVYSEGQLLKQLILENGQVVNLTAEEDFYYVGTSDAQSSKFELQYGEDTILTDSVRKGEILDTLAVTLQGKEIGSINLVSDQDVHVDGTASETDEGQEEVLSAESRDGIWMVLGGIGLIAAVLMVIRTINIRRRRKRHRRRLQEHRRKMSSKQSDSNGHFYRN